MKKRIKKVLSVILIGAALLLTANALYAQESAGVLSNLDIGVSGSFDVYSKYVWRGFTLDTDFVVQPGMNISWKDFTFSFWSSWDADNDDDLNSDEVDYAFDYTKGFENFDISFGHTYYDFPGVGLFSREFYVGLSLPKVLLTPSLTYYHDYGTHSQGGGHGQYLALGLSHSFVIVSEPEVTLDLSTNIGYNRKLFIAGDAGGDFLVSGGFTIPLTKKLACLPTVNYAVPFGDLRDSDDGDQKNRFYGGVSFQYSF